MLVPAMHRSMYDHPFVAENLAKLETAGVRVLVPRLEEGKAKAATEQQVFEAVRDALAPGPLAGLKGKHVVVTAGRTVEYLDPIRVLTNNSTGRMGLALAEAAQRAGARVTVVAGKLSVPVPPGIEVIHTDTAEAMFEACRAVVAGQRPDVFLAAAAVGDWTPAHPSPVKLPTAGGRLVLELVPTPKILDRVKEWSQPPLSWRSGPGRPGRRRSRGRRPGTAGESRCRPDRGKRHRPARPRVRNRHQRLASDRRFG